MNTETQTLVDVLNSRMEKMTSLERLDLMNDLMRGYCKECGYELQDGRCHCLNDE